MRRSTARPEFEDWLILPSHLTTMLSNCPYAADLSLVDRLRPIADGFPADSLEYGTLQLAADTIEEAVATTAKPERRPDGTRGL